MARRAVKRIDPSLDLSGWLFVWDDLPRPWDGGARLFDPAPAETRRPLEVEVGSGKGMFLRRAATARPGHDFLGIEIAHQYARHTAATLAREGLANARMLSGDGTRLFRELLPTASVDAVHVYFPDPWWKKRHAKRRVMNEAFLCDVARTLRPGGSLHFWTDVPDYFESSVALLSELAAAGLSLEGPHAVPETPAEHELDFHTHFERRTRLNDQPVYRSEYLRGPAAWDAGLPARLLAPVGEATESDATSEAGLPR
ncbi:MAG: tRNA (guanosine(46)-N7)-methyltransferase TrmB [Lacipirellulaceae bacterium]